MEASRREGLLSGHRRSCKLIFHQDCVRTILAGKYHRCSRLRAIFIEGNFSRLRARSAHFVGHLPAAKGQKPAPPPTTTTPPPTYPAGLTAREVEVLRLLAGGLTDLQIAEKLVLSPRTVHAHISSIYSKLGVTSRSAAPRYAIEHHLA
jgi:DNA-binding NarL/FixJ family response regulator